MTLTISPALEEKIAHKAKCLGLSANEYVEEVLTRDVASKGVFLGKGKPLTGDEFVSAMKNVAQPAPDWLTPNETFSREIIYRDDE
jgi:hypothetical protein